LRSVPQLQKRVDAPELPFRVGKISKYDLSQWLFIVGGTVRFS
jgi:hypothetical protein